MSTFSYAKPLPVPDADSAPFWQGCHSHRLLLQRCSDCATVRYPAAPVCPHCRSRQSTWTEASGHGNVFSWIVVRHPVPAEVYGDDVPYVVALIDLAEGPRMASNIVDCEPADLQVGMAVRVVFHDVTPDITLPRFQPQRAGRQPPAEHAAAGS